MDSKTTRAGTPILGLLGILFIALKLCGVIAWSWWWVLSPFWGFPVAVVVICLVVFISAIITGLAKQYVAKP